MMRIKWQNPQQQGRVHKRSRTATTTAEKQQYYKKRRLYNKNKTNGSSSSSSSKDLNELENKVTYSLDSLATITVMYNSLKHAYDNSKPELDQTSTATRLGEMERELLTAYDDLGLQVRHLARDMSKLEKQIKETTVMARRRLVRPPWCSMTAIIRLPWHCLSKQPLHLSIMFPQQQQQQHRHYSQQRQQPCQKRGPVTRFMVAFQRHRLSPTTTHRALVQNAAAATMLVGRVLPCCNSNKLYLSSPFVQFTLSIYVVMMIPYPLYLFSLYTPLSSLFMMIQCSLHPTHYL
ncbi:hypothetical protein BDB00DRAFT_140350 [Zychaea mexicana]|uniref:uncharacterized protein n=1 Tax=Zychaea mexicana TaxID=64656 RepID=UPI0022FE506A|nr:uncharacterized protein BDB00DRAFT_140350 [Zychaea mexicana]KAI9496275.1 hypothetical protein BDB00DRAFT_140350 [Zychaea mexicana]